MTIETKYAVGQDVCLFNGVSMEIEHDEVYAVLTAPEPVPGKVIEPAEPVSKGLAEGNLKMGYRYQLQHHQGLLDEKILFGSEDELKKFYSEFFKD